MDHPDGYEVVIAGGGPAGSAAAIVLGRAGRRTLLVEPRPQLPVKVGEALPPVANASLRELGVLEHVRVDGHLPCYGNLSVWGGPEVRCTDFIFDPHGSGWHLDRARFDARLREVATTAGVEVRGASLIGARKRPSDGWRVTIADPDTNTRGEVHCRWLVDATGRRSSVARRQGARRRADDRLIAFCTSFRPAPSAPPDRDSRTLIESSADGWWYTALIPSGRRIVAYFSDADLVPPGVSRAPEVLLELLSRTRCLLPTLAVRGYEPEGPFRAAPAQSALSVPACGDGWCTVGDAALSLDPLSSQGLLNALNTGLACGRAVHARLFGDRGALARYGREVASIYATYQEERAAHYALEGRWADRPFWSRRRETAAAGAESKPGHYGMVSRNQAQG